MTTSVVGNSFRPPAAKAALARLKTMQRLRCVREPNNKYDRYAVAIYVGDIHIGYLSKGVAKDMSVLLDGGLPIEVFAIRAGTGLVELRWPDAGLQSPAGDGFEDDPLFEEETPSDRLQRQLEQSVARLKPSRLVPPKPPSVRPPARVRPSFPELDLPPEEPDTRPDPWE